RGPARTKLDAERIGEALVCWQLSAMKDLDPVACELERIERRAVASGGGPIDLVGGHPQADPVGVDALEFSGELHEGSVAVGGNVSDDGAHRLLDVGRGLPLGGKKSAKSLGKIAGMAVEADRHGRILRPVLPDPRSLLNDKLRNQGGQPRASGPSSTWTGRALAGQEGPRSASSTPRPSTSSPHAPPPPN